VIALLLATSIASAGWEETDRDNGCVFFKATATEASGAQPVRAECDWPVPPKTLHHMLGKIADHDLYFSNISKCEPVSGHPTWTWQLHETAGISPREVVLEMGEEDIAGGKRFTWTKAGDQSTNSGAGVEIALNTGMWEITDNGSGGAKVVYELRYLPGGKVPGFMVRWFQGAGMQSFIGELRTYAEKHAR
jgi:hypothetical protein